MTEVGQFKDLLQFIYYQLLELLILLFRLDRFIRCSLYELKSLKISIIFLNYYSAVARPNRGWCFSPALLCVYGQNDSKRGHWSSPYFKERSTWERSWTDSVLETSNVNTIMCGETLKMLSLAAGAQSCSPWYEIKCIQWQFEASVYDTFHDPMKWCAVSSTSDIFQTCGCWSEGASLVVFRQKRWV